MHFINKSECFINSVQSHSRLGHQGEHHGQFRRHPLPVFPVEGYRKQFQHRQGHPLSDIVHSAFPLPTAVLPTIQGALKGGFGETCHSTWQTQTMWVSWQLTEEEPGDSQGGWSCSTTCPWSCALRRELGEISTGSWSHQPGSFSWSQKAESMSKP